MPAIHGTILVFFGFIPIAFAALGNLCMPLGAGEKMFWAPLKTVGLLLFYTAAVSLLISLQDRLGEFLREAHPATTQITPKWKPTKVRGVILNAVPGSADTHDAKNNIRTRLKHEQGSTAFSATATILPIEIRESVTATRLAGKYNTTGVPAVLAASDNPGLAEDYSKLANYIHTHCP